MSRVATTVLFIAFALLTAPPTRAQDDTDAEETPQKKDERAIGDLGKAWEFAWNRHDQKALSQLIAEDGEFITVEFGQMGVLRLRGRDQFARSYAAKHNTWFVASHWKTGEISVRFLRPDLALARVNWTTVGDKVPHRKHGERREGLFTWVVEKRAGAWTIIASQETEAMPALPGQ